MTAYSSQSRLAALLRCGPLWWQVLPLRDRSKGFLIPIPPSKSFHAFVNGIRLALVIGIVGDVGFAPPANLILFFPSQLTIVLVRQPSIRPLFLQLLWLAVRFVVDQLSLPLSWIFHCTPNHNPGHTKSRPATPTVDSLYGTLSPDSRMVMPT